MTIVGIKNILSTTLGEKILACTVIGERIPIMDCCIQVKSLRISPDAAINIDRYRLNRSA